MSEQTVVAKAFSIKLRSARGNFCALDCTDYRSVAGELLKRAERVSDLADVVSIYGRDASTVSELQQIISSTCHLLMKQVMQRANFAELPSEIVQLGTRDELRIKIIELEVGPEPAPSAAVEPLDFDDLDGFWATGQLDLVIEA